jgi:hypothetical protein
MMQQQQQQQLVSSAKYAAPAPFAVAVSSSSSSVRDSNTGLSFVRARRLHVDDVATAAATARDRRREARARRAPRLGRELEQLVGQGSKHDTSPSVGFRSIVPEAGASFVTTQHQLRTNSFDKTC